MFFLAFIVILAQVLKVSPHTHSATPPPLGGWRQKAPEEGVALLLAGRKGRLGQQVCFAQPVWERGGVTVQAAGGGREQSLPSHPTPALGGTQAQALGKGPGNLSLEVASLVVSALQS